MCAPTSCGGDSGAERFDWRWRTAGLGNAYAGHELTAMHGLDHAQTLAIVLPALWNEKRDTKRAKLLQYAERIWNITEGSDDERIDAAIAATRNFFEQLGVPTHLSDYGLDGSSIPALLKKLEEHSMTQLGENHDITLDVSRRIYEAAR
ncbi:putative alcohol dehydrogenase [Escherichia coli]|uniref:Putative alcohol dehydrogenase n=1 Tax=Escherichia coli TaxID=562 RepID=A0A485J9Q7_ECOLX|nr:putative alcohol dehydrogenase [Escherichia coli]